MKVKVTKPPGITQLYNQRINHNAHLKKLESIKHHRKIQLGIDQQRNNLLYFIRNKKAYSFANNFNEQKQLINQNNLKLIKKLDTIKPSTVCQPRSTRRQDNHSSISNRSRISMKEKFKQEQTEKQNLRLFVKLNSVSSSINSLKLISGYSQTQRIKQRLMRYSQDADNPQKIELKSQRYINKTSIYSKPSNGLGFLNKSMQMKPRSIVNHYKKQEIISNKLKNIQRKFTTLKVNKQMSYEQKTFLTRQSQENQMKSSYVKDLMKSNRFKGKKFFCHTIKEEKQSKISFSKNA